MQIVRLLMLVVLILFGWTRPAQATVVAKDCNGCTETQYASLARSLAMAAGQATGQRFIYDLANGNLRVFNIEREPNGTGGYHYFANPTTPSSSQLSAFNVQKSAIQENGGASTFHGHVSSTFPTFPHPNITGTQFASSNYYRNTIGNWIVGGCDCITLNNLGQTVTGLAEAAFSIVLSDDLLTFTITVILADGSKAIYTTQANSPIAVLISLQDVNGNTIPLTVDEAAPNQYHFPQGGGAGFAGYLHDQFGFEVRGELCRNGTLACITSGSPENSVRTCEWIHCRDMQ